MGGGSGLDGAKATCLTALNDIDLWAFNYDVAVPDVSAAQPFPPLICIPTTSGTGAETESTAMITDTQRGMKLCVWHPTLKPSLALLDPELTPALFAHLTVDRRRRPGPRQRPTASPTITPCVTVLPWRAWPWPIAGCGPRSRNPTT